MPLPMYVLMVVVQIALAIHVAKTGRELFWIYIIVFIPVIGAVIYLIAVLLPEMRQDRRARRAARRVATVFNPGAERRQLEDRLHGADTIKNRAALAEVCLRDGEFERAGGLFASCLSGMHKTDPDYMLGLAQAFFGQGKHAACRRTLEELIQANPEFRSEAGHLLYARTPEALGERELALTEYDALSLSFSGEEARYRHGKLLVDLGRGDDARRVFEQMLNRVKSAPRYYKDKERVWLDQARSELGKLGKA